ncbi:hypothetical protein FB45DRAFT_913943 [Roridomyces roridus]|uniref:Uncharacterized protein n=1 Tax=Roridomyces roridus TaxID=1738132 RepID=A0AAD7BXC1_9AGAR|nr:hypothetical protein FB45DRAFT_913943 [Roridomyces roridus]
MLYSHLGDAMAATSSPYLFESQCLKIDQTYKDLASILPRFPSAVRPTYKNLGSPSTVSPNLAGIHPRFPPTVSTCLSDAFLIYFLCRGVHAALHRHRSSPVSSPCTSSDCTHSSSCRSENGACNPGSYLDGTNCVQCPAGSYCADGKTKQPCDIGMFQPNTNSVECIKTQPGYYQNVSGSIAQIPCDEGSYQPYVQQYFCYGAPSGRFQGLTGQATVCGTCCGWATTKDNYNVEVFRCSDPTPNSYAGSGSGCLPSSNNTDCATPATCAQDVTGGCPAETWGA